VSRVIESLDRDMAVSWGGGTSKEKAPWLGESKRSGQVFFLEAMIFFS